MKRIVIYCPCGQTKLSSDDIDDGNSEFTLIEGIGDDAPCCSMKKPKSEDKGDYMFRHSMENVKPLKKDKRR